MNDGFSDTEPSVAEGRVSALVTPLCDLSMMHAEQCSQSPEGRNA
jgi:hypothetical protein